jgi:hypothetical protein
LHRGHRRAASASADIGSWSMSIPNECEGTTEQLSDGSDKLPLHKIVKTCALTSTLQSKTRTKWKNGAVRWAGSNQQDVEEAIPLNTSQLSQVSGSYQIMQRLFVPPPFRSLVLS